MGIEFDKWSRPVAYHLYKSHPNERITGNIYAGSDKVRVPAEDMIHLYLPMRVSQNRGLPWIHTAITRLNMAGAYEEAELVAARIGASSMGFMESDIATSKFVGDDTENADGTGANIMEISPGQFRKLPPGLKMNPFIPEHPTTAFPAFMKAMLRGLSSGVGVSYNKLANDLEGVNYSSIRQGELDERDVWRDIQVFLYEHFNQIVFEDWLTMALSTQAIKLPLYKYDKFNNARWQPRGWQWVDPQKDVNSSIMAINNNLTTISDVLAEQGKDFYEVTEKRRQENEHLKQLGLTLSDDKKSIIVESEIEEEKN
jgi:lambda family phage portal protein